MKFGVITFGYDKFPGFEKSLQNDGYYDINLGDFAQSISIKNIYNRLGIDDSQIIRINRDALPEYDSGPAIVIMNGVFYPSSFPLPTNITPIFIGFHAAKHTIETHHDFLRRHQPIGCRDDGTTKLMQSYGIEAFTTGCITLSLDPRTEQPKKPKLLIVYGRGAGHLPGGVLRKIPYQLLKNAEFIFHRLPANKFPFGSEMRMAAESYEQALFDRYRREATLVLTSLHHVATPCMAFGIPVIICRRDDNVRFSTIEKLTPIYTPGKFGLIDWNPAPVDVSIFRANLLDLAEAKIKDALSGAERARERRHLFSGLFRRLGYAAD